MENLESLQKIESPENYNSKVAIHIFRHGEKEVAGTRPDFAIELTDQGRQQAMDKSVPGTVVEQSVAFGSRRKRARQTAAFAMTGQLDKINGDESLDQLYEKLDKNLKISSKIGIDYRLDFNIDFNSEYGKQVGLAMDNDQLMTFLVEKSDDLASKLNDTEGLTYSRAAANIAKILQKYLKVGERWNSIVKNGNYKSNTLERFLGTHQGVLDSFLAKVIEKTKGKDELDKFLSAMNGAGFNLVEGFKVEIINQDNGQKVNINYKKEKNGQKVYEFYEQVPENIINEIAKG